MRYADRQGNRYGETTLQDRFLKTLYESAWGRTILKLLVCPAVSKAGGAMLNSPLSKLLICPFVKKHGIDLSACEKQEFTSYNDFFMRKMKPEAHPVDGQPEHLIAPCDSRLTVCQIERDTAFYIKHTEYTLYSLLRDRRLVEKYTGGQALVFRLTVEDYHRYCYVDNGKKTHNRKLKGILHTVNPAANDVYPIYKENAREYSILRSEHFGDILTMEVGALMVGKIVNEHERAYVQRGQEKEHFEFGGSTVILLLEPGKAVLDRDILIHSQMGYETFVHMGERIGKRP